jgi:hypothetical protein
MEYQKSADLRTGGAFYPILTGIPRRCAPLLYLCTRKMIQTADGSYFYYPFLLEFYRRMLLSTKPCIRIFGKLNDSREGVAFSNRAQITDLRLTRFKGLWRALPVLPRGHCKLGLLACWRHLCY